MSHIPESINIDAKKLSDAFTSLVETHVGEIKVISAHSSHKVKDYKVPRGELDESKSRNNSLNRLSLTDTRISNIRGRKTGRARKH